MLDSYFVKVVLMFLGAGAGISAVVTGFYGLYVTLTYLGT